MISSKIAIFGNIYTGDASSSFAEALITEDEKITFIGSKSDAEKLISGDTEVITLKDEEIAMPGFIDTHVHPILASMRNFGLIVTNVETSFDKLKEAFKNYMDIHPDQDVIVAYGFFFNHFPDLPNKKYLDEISSEKAILLWRFDCHAVLLNSKAIELAKITKDTVFDSKMMPKSENDVTGLWHEKSVGIIEKDQNGELTGQLLETAMTLVNDIVPKVTHDMLSQAFDFGTKTLLSEGITTFMDACVRPFHYPIYKSKYSKDYEKLPKCFLSIGWNNNLHDLLSDKKNENVSLADVLDFKENDKFTVNTVKFFADGVVEDKTALTNHKYCCGNHGVNHFSEKDMKDFVSLLHNKRIRCHIHAIGDAAIKQALDSLENAKKLNDSYDPRHYIAHNQIVDDKDIERFPKLNISGNFTPFWVKWHLDSIVNGYKNIKQYKIREYIDKGVNVCFGSDWPVTTPRPLENIEASITRRAMGASNETKPDHEDQAITLKEALRAYHLGGAYVLYRDHETGSLEKGKKADITVLDKNIFKCDSNKIHEAKTILTLVNGVIAYKA